MYRKAKGGSKRTGATSSSGGSKKPTKFSTTQQPSKPPADSDSETSLEDPNLPISEDDDESNINADDTDGDVQMEIAGASCRSSRPPHSEEEDLEEDDSGQEDDGTEDEVCGSREVIAARKGDKNYRLSSVVDTPLSPFQTPLERLGLDPHGEEGSSKDEKKKRKKPGIIYLSSIPIGYNVCQTIMFYSQFGQVGRVFLQPDSKEKAQSRDQLSRRFTEGWIEFASKKVAKRVALSLNKMAAGANKRSIAPDAIWNVKYLPHFKWSHLSERLPQEKWRAGLSEAKRRSDYCKDKSRKKKKKKHAKKSKRQEEEGSSSSGQRRCKLRQKNNADEANPRKTRRMSHGADLAEGEVQPAKRIRLGHGLESNSNEFQCSASAKSKRKKGGKGKNKSPRAAAASGGPSSQVSGREEAALRNAFKM